MSESEQFIWGTGRRKSAVARVRIRKGTGEIKINNRLLNDYFPTIARQQNVLAPLYVTNTYGKYDVYANVKGGGQTGQSDAVLLGIARALGEAIPSSKEKLRDHGHLTRDSRMIERKKYGRKKARRSFQFSKR